jgi:hypothetical protein
MFKEDPDKLNGIDKENHQCYTLDFLKNMNIISILGFVKKISHVNT